MSRAFPSKCRTCGKHAVKKKVVDYVTEREHDGRTYSFTVPALDILECEECHARVLSGASREKVEEALRVKAGLLTPTNMRENRIRLGYTQERLARELRVAKETVSRWETGGQIQQRAMDLLLRLFFGLPQVRKVLADDGGLQRLGTKPIEVGLQPVILDLSTIEPVDPSTLISCSLITLHAWPSLPLTPVETSRFSQSDLPTPLPQGDIVMVPERIKDRMKSLKG